MKKTSMHVLLSLFLIAMTAGIVSAADVAKIGIIDFQKVLTTSSAGKFAKTEINKKGSEMEATLKGKEEEILELRKNLEREALVMSEEKSEEKQRDIRIKINDLKTMQQTFTKQFKELEARMVTKIKNEVMELTQSLGKKDGYLLILEKNEAGAMYFPESIDITDMVIKEYNKTFVEGN